jgi:hypothetical protein
MYRPKHVTGCNVRTPITFHLTYLTLLILAGYSLGVKIVTPFGDTPTGFAVDSNAWGGYDTINMTNVDALLIGVRNSASPIGYQDVPRVTSTGFQVMLPLTGTTKVTKEGTFSLKFLKPLPAEIEIPSIEIINSRTGSKCQKVSYDACLPKDQDSFIVNAEGCDTRTASQDHGVLSYSIVMKYTIKLGSVTSTKVNSGQIRIWL